MKLSETPQNVSERLANDPVDYVILYVISDQKYQLMDQS